MHFLIGTGYCFNTPPARDAAALRMAISDSRFTDLVRLLSWKVLGWWSGIGWSGGRGLGGVVGIRWMVGDVVSVAWGCGGGRITHGVDMGGGEGVGSGQVAWWMWCPELYPPNTLVCHGPT